MTRYEETLLRKRSQFGDKFDCSELAAVSPAIREAYNSRHRTRIQFPDNSTADGYVGITTGWRPAFILLYNKRSISSAIVLGPDDHVVRVFSTVR